MHSLALTLVLATACTAANTGRTDDAGDTQAALVDAGQPSRPAGVEPPPSPRPGPLADAGPGQPADAGAARPGTASPEGPSLEQSQAEAWDTRRPLAQRLESALRAATLEPRDTGMRKLLGELFYQRQLELAAADKKPKEPRTFTVRCHLIDEFSCIKMDIASFLLGIGVDGASKERQFVVALGNREQVKVFRGTYTTRPYPEKPETVLVTYTVLAEEGFKPTQVLQDALFTLCGPQAPCNEPPGSVPLGRYVLDEASQALLSPLPREWAQLKPAGSTSGPFARPSFNMQWDCAEDRPFLLELAPDVHGRWRLRLPGKDGAWISAVEKTEGGLRLTLVSEDLYPERVVTTKQVLFKPPEAGKDVASLGDEPFSSNLRRYPPKPYPCP